MAGGRPRIHDKDAIAKALLEWAAKEDSINLNGFCVSLDPPIPPQYITRFADECEGFREAYNTAKAWLAVRRERKLKNGELHVKAYDLNAAVYDYFLKKERREEKEFDAALKQNAEKETVTDVIRQISQLAKDLDTVPGTEKALRSEVENLQSLLNQGQERQ